MIVATLPAALAPRQSVETRQAEACPDLRSIIAGQARIIDGHYRQGLPLTAESLLRLADVAEQLALREELSA
jgi:hypothetical protein